MDQEPELVHSFWRDLALKIPSEHVWGTLEILVNDLDKIRCETEALAERTDIDDDEREVARRIADGLAIWSELVLDGTEGE
jgi:hypothetical protein